MNAPIEAEYGRLVIELRSYLQAQKCLVQNWAMAPLRHPLRFFRLTLSMMRLDYLGSGNPEIYRAFASKKNKSNRWFPIITADFPLQALSTTIRQEFPATEVSLLVKYHEIKGAQLKRLDFKGVIAAAFAAIALVLKSIPESVIKTRFEIDYVEFEEIVFWFTVAVLGYLVLVLAPAWVKVHRTRLVHRFIGDVLAYMEICDSSESAPTHAKC